MSTLDDIKKRAEGHTPGPWRFDADGWLETEGPSTNGYVIAPGPYSHDEVQCFQFEEADAELIAAAPKLLAALEAVEGVLSALDEIQANCDTGVENVYAGRVSGLLSAAISEALA